MTASTPSGSVTDEAKSFTGWKLDYLKAACADPRVSAGSFRLMFRVMSAVNSATKVAVLADDTIQDEVAGFKEQGTCRKHRKRIAELGYWKVRPGFGPQATEYTFLDMPAAAVVNGLEEARKKRHEKRKRRRDDYRLKLKDQSDQTAPSHTMEQSTQTAPSTVEQSGQTGGEQSIRTAGAVCVDGYTPSYTPSTIPDAHDQKVSSYAHAREDVGGAVVVRTIGDALDHIDAQAEDRSAAGLASADVERAEKVISEHIERESRKVGLTIEAAIAVIGDELARIKRAVADFPGDADRAGRRIRRLLTIAKGGRDAA